MTLHIFFGILHIWFSNKKMKKTTGHYHWVFQGFLDGTISSCVAFTLFNSKIFLLIVKV